MDASTSSTRRVVTSAWALFLAFLLLMVGNGLQGSLVGVRANLEGFPTFATGVVMAGYFIGFLAGSSFTARVVHAVGHVRVYAGLASLASTTVLLHALVINISMWFMMRVVTGFCLAGLYVVAESWLNGASTNHTRGRTLSVYMLVVMGGGGVGHLLLGVGDPSRFDLFILASVLTSLAVVPISLARIHAPRPETTAVISIKELLRLAPLGVVGTLVTGIANGAFVGFGAVYATEAGMSPARVGLFMGLTLAGSIVLQWPLGSLSDRVPRRRMILVVTSLAAVVAAWATTADITSGGILALAFLFGGLTFPMYTLCISHVNDMVTSDRMVAASAAMIFVTGVGAVFGPPVAALAVHVLGPAGFWVSLAVVHGSLGVYATYRLTRRASAVLRQQRWDNLPARSSPQVAYLLREKADTSREPPSPTPADEISN